MDTTGLLIVSKNSHCQDHLSKQMKENKVKKIYVALVKGCLENDKGKIDAPIGRLYEDHVLRGVVSDGFPSVTNYKVLQRYYNLVVHEVLVEGDDAGGAAASPLSVKATAP